MVMMVPKFKPLSEAFLLKVSAYVKLRNTIVETDDERVIIQRELSTLKYSLLQDFEQACRVIAEDVVQKELKDRKK
jgi:hypothetical protein